MTIAVVGAGCRFPGADSVRAFWQLLRHGREGLAVLSDDELLAAGATPDDLVDPDYVRAAMLAPGVADFDAAFFGLSDSAADRCDPGARLFLETAYAAVEDAGYNVATIRAGAAVFAAALPSRYRELHLRGDGVDDPEVAAFTSRMLDLRGPSVTLASCSLHAVHLAAQALTAGECDVALAGGTHVEFPYGHGYRWTPGGGRPPDGHARPFDVAASGCVPGSGVGVVVLKRLEDAIDDGDLVRAVIGGSATGHAGAEADGAATVIAEALSLADRADGVGYVEADGASQVTADARELTALHRGLELAGHDLRPGSIRLGSVKSNVGHLRAAAGVAGLLKVVLALQHEYLPATLNVTAPHPELGLDGSPLRLANQPGAWPGTPRRALVNAVSPGGAVTALVVDAGPSPGRPAPSGARGRPQVVVWSGRQPSAVEDARAGLAGFLATVDDDQFADIAATLRCGRTAHEVRRAAVCASAAEAVDVLTSGDVIASERPATEPPDVVFSFPGLRHGQRLPIGLYGVVPAFTEAADVCLDAFESRGVDLYDRWLAGRADGDVAAALLFTAEYALAATWRAWGVRPAAAVGVGVGGIAAAVDDGSLDLDAAVDAVNGRAEHQPSAAPDVDNAVVVTVGPAETDDDERELLTAAARLWVSGVPVDWAQLAPGRDRQRLPAPGYPFQRRRHWVVPDDGPAAPKQQRPTADELPVVPAVEVSGLPAPAQPVRSLGRTQHAFWILDQLAPDSGVSNIGIAFRAAQPLRWYPLQTAANHLVRRHPALRLRFPEVAGTPVRHLTPAADAQLSIQTHATTEEKLVADLQEFLHTPFDLRADLPFRLGHFTLPGGESVVCFAAHHIVIDAPSVQILLEELGQIYDGVAATGAVPAELADEALLLAEPEPEPADVQYWLDHLRGVQPGAMLLPGSRPAPSRPTFAGHTCSWPMTERAQQALAALSRECRTSDNVVLMSAFCLTLLRHGVGPDLVFGVPVGTRRPATAKQVGYGVSTMPLRVRVDPRAGFKELTERVGAAFFGGVEHADASVERVITERGHRTDDWRVPLFRHMFNYRPWSDEQIRICGQVPDYIEDLFDRSRLDLQCIAVPEPDRLTLRCWHSTEVHDEAAIEAFVARMQALLEQAGDEPERPVGELAFASASDDATWRRVNRTQRVWDGPPTVLERIAATAAATPSAVAIWGAAGGRELSYADLIAGAVAVRNRLREGGVRPGQVVALAMKRSAELAAAILGVWACGASYLPLDPDHPPARLRGLVDDASAAVVLAAAAAEWSPVPVVDVPAGSTAPGPLLDDQAPAPDDPAYVIYTSGSTGTPKGVVVTHRNLHNLVSDFAERLGPDTSAMVWSTTPTFDISALELFVPLQSGGRVVVADDDALLKPSALLDLVRSQDVRAVQATPTAWRLILPADTGELAGRTLLCGGEPMAAALARDLRRAAGPGRVLNVYGPTETTIWSTVAVLDADHDDPVPIGVPITNTQVFVLDEQGQELPPGVPGEVCIAGDGVSAGYLGRAELTARRFGEHPRYGRFYRTGDVGLLRHDGTVELRGRDDRQVKVRGHRIELGEVEHVVGSHPDVALAAVTLDAPAGQDGRLLAFVQPAAGASGDSVAGLPERLWRHAREALPDYAVPSGITVLQRLPTTPNGKIDYRSLPAERPPERAAASTHGPADPGLTATLVELWRDVLRRPQLTADDNFFLNGGHSILAARTVTRIEQTTGQAVDVGKVFAHPTPAQLAAHLASRMDQPHD